MQFMNLILEDSSYITAYHGARDVVKLTLCKETVQVIQSSSYHEMIYFQGEKFIGYRKSDNHGQDHEVPKLTSIRTCGLYASTVLKIINYLLHLYVYIYEILDH